MSAILRTMLAASAVSVSCLLFAVPVSAAIAAGAPVNMNIFGANQNFANYDNLMHSTPFANLVKALGINNMRYVAGSPSSFWEWQQGRFIPEAEITAIWPSPWFVTNYANDWVNARPAGTFAPAAFDSFVTNAGVAQNQWITNVTTREADQPAFIQHLHDQGYNYDIVEMDNETYFWGNEFAIGGQPGRNYGLRFKPTSQKIRSLNPNAKIGAVFREQGIFTDEPLTTTAWNGNWNGELYGELNQSDMAEPMYDALILHHYAMNSNALSSYSMADVPSAFLAYPQATMERGARIVEQNFGDLPIWITEYNVIAYNQSSGGGTQGQWIRDTAFTGWNALYQASFMLAAMAMPDDYTVLNHHSVLGSQGWALGDDVSNTSGKVNATGQLFSFLSYLAEGAETTHAVEPDTNPLLGLTIEGETGIGAFQAVALNNDTTETLTLLVINRDDQAQDFELADYGGYQNMTVFTYHADDPGATGYKAVSYNNGPIFYQSDLPLTPDVSGTLLDPYAGLLVALPEYSLSIITLTNPIDILVGDLDGDGFVGIADLNVVLGNWNQSVIPGDTADPSGDGYVGIEDLNMVLSNWNSGAAPLDSSSIPEPTSVMLLGLPLLGLLKRAHPGRAA